MDAIPPAGGAASCAIADDAGTSGSAANVPRIDLLVGAVMRFPGVFQ